MSVVKINSDNFGKDELAEAVRILDAGGVIAYPTETVYGLGADIFCEDAVNRLYKIKGRNAHKAVTMMVASQADIQRYCTAVSSAASAMMAAFWPGPLTLIFKASAAIPDYFAAENNTIGVRFPDHKISNTLVDLLRRPITSTSANSSGGTPARDVRGMPLALQAGVDLILDAGQTVSGIPSTVVDVSTGKVVILREGAISAKAILAC